MAYASTHNVAPSLVIKACLVWLERLVGWLLEMHDGQTMLYRLALHGRKAHNKQATRTADDSYTAGLKGKREMEQIQARAALESVQQLIMRLRRELGMLLCLLDPTHVHLSKKPRQCMSQDGTRRCILPACDVLAANDVQP